MVSTEARREATGRVNASIRRPALVEKSSEFTKAALLGREVTSWRMLREATGAPEVAAEVARAQVVAVAIASGELQSLNLEILNTTQPHLRGLFSSSQVSQLWTMDGDAERV